MRLVAAGAAIVAAAFAVGAFVVAPLLVDGAVRRYAAHVPDRHAQVERIRINPFTLTVELGGVELREPQAGAVLTLDRVLVNFDFLTLFQQARVLDELSIERPRLTIDPTRESSGDARFSEMLAAVLPARPIRIQRFAIAEGRLEIGGGSPDTERRIVLEHVAVSANDLASHADSPGDYRLTARDAAGASLQLQGELTFEPLVTDGRIEIQSLALETLRPWLGERFAAARAVGFADLAAEYSIAREADAAVFRLSGATAELRALTFELDDGAAATVAEVGVLGDAELSLSGGIWVGAGGGSLDASGIAVRDVNGELLFASEHAAASGVSIQQPGLDAEAPHVSIEALSLRRPETRVFVDSHAADPPEGGTRVSHPLSGLLSVDAADASAIPVQRVELIDARLDVVDRDFSPPVLLRSTAVNGTLVRAAREDEGLLADLEGDVGESGSGKIVVHVGRDGEAAQRDVQLAARSIDAAAVSRYFSKFSGRELAGGLLDFDIEYRLRGVELEGHARIGALDLAFAEAGAVDRPGWDLAAALLEDESGRLEVATPLSSGSNGSEDVDNGSGADVDDLTGGGISAAVVGALAGLASRVTSAPFDVLGTLAGREAEALDSISFEPGAAAPSEAGLDALEDLSRALAQRPRLALLIAGRADPELDRDALAAQQIELHVTLATAGPTRVARPTPVDFSSPRAWDVLNEFATERLSAEELATIASYFPLDAAGQVAAAERPSYYRALFDALVANEPIPVNALNRLGRYRAQSIADTLADFDIGTDRTRVVDTQVTAAARERLLPPPDVAAAPLPGDGAPFPADPGQDAGTVQSLPERIAVPLELQALATLEVEAQIPAVTGEAAADSPAGAE